MLSFEERLNKLNDALEEAPRAELMKQFNLYEVVRTEEEALRISEDGDKVGVGYPNSHLVYRVSVNKNREGEILGKSLSFQYHV